MVIVDTSPVGEEMLDAVLKGLMRIGLRKRPATYIRRYFDIVRLSKDLAYLRAAGMAPVRAPRGQRKAINILRDGGRTPGRSRASRLPRPWRAGAAASVAGRGHRSG